MTLSYPRACWILVVTGTFESLLIYTGFAVVLFSGVSVAALYVLRRPHAVEAVVLPGVGGRVLLLTFVAASLVIVVNALWRSPGPAVAGLLVILAGVPIFYGLRRRGDS